MDLITNQVIQKEDMIGCIRFQQVLICVNSACHDLFKWIFNMGDLLITSWIKLYSLFLSNTFVGQVLTKFFSWNRIRRTIKAYTICMTLCHWKNFHAIQSTYHWPPSIEIDLCLSMVYLFHRNIKGHLS